MSAPELILQDAIIEDGFYPDMPNWKYHGSMSHYSSSIVKKFGDKTPARILFDRQNPKEQAPNAIYDFGSLVHAKVLTPQLVDSEFIILPEFNLRKPAHREEKERLVKLAQDEHRLIITEEMFERATQAALAIAHHPQAAPLLENSINESSIFWNSDGVPLKVRPDAACCDMPVLSDIKTTSDPGYSAMLKSTLNYGYDVSAAMYLDGVNQCEEFLSLTGQNCYESMILICVNSEPPHEVALYDLRQAIEKGRQKLDHYLAILKDSIHSGWKSYPSYIRELEPPPWANRINEI